MICFKINWRFFVNKKLGACLFSLVGMFVILTSMETYKERSLGGLTSTEAAFSKEAQGLNVVAKTYTPGESRSFLQRNLIKSGYQPIQITVQNNTSNSYNLSAEGISMPTASAGKVAGSVSKKALPRGIALKIASLLFWPFMIPSTIDGIITLKTHISLHKDFSAKSVKEKQEIVAPYSTYNRVIFVPLKQLKDTLTVTLIDQDSDEHLSFISPVTKSDKKLTLDPIE